jgi:hypothetical protein
MQIRRVLALGVAIALGATATPALAQRNNNNRNQPQQQRPAADPDTIALVRLVDSAIVTDAGAAAAPAVTSTSTTAPSAGSGDKTQGEIPLKWETNHFVKGQGGITYIPFTVTFDPAAVSTTDVALYIRVVRQDQMAAAVAALTPPATPPAGNNRGQQPAAPAVPTYAWDNIAVIKKPADGKLTRAIALPPGDYVAFIALKERSAPPADAKAAATAAAAPMKTGLLRHAVTAPDFNKMELQTSSVILASSVEPIAQQLTPAEQEANPYVFGPMRIVPTAGRFSKASELQVIFWIYGATDGPGGKPDVTVEFNFHQKAADGTEKYFNKTEPQVLNATTLPPEFNVAAGHQLPGSLVVALTPFPVGDYRLEIKITDKPSGKVVTQNVNFTVVPV